jgi:glycosyltransferase involved in cell wall biosynthesis
MHPKPQESAVTSENRYRILMFSLYFPPQYSGAAKQALSLAKQLREMGHYVEFATVRWPGVAAEHIVDGFPVHHLDQGRSVKHRELRLWWNLFRFLFRRRADFDILHSHGAYYTNCIVGPLARCFGLKSVVKASLADNDLHGIGKSLVGKIHRIFLRRIDACIATSRDLENEFKASGISPQQIFYLPNGVDTDRFRPAICGEKAELRRKLNLPVENQIALTVGVFVRRKNIGWLIEQWTNNNAFETGALLLTVGPKAREDANGGFLASLHEMAVKYSSILKVQEFAEDIELYYRAADFFILPSLNEGLPNVILEAMASGLPCIASAVSGTRELVTDGKTGWIFEPGNPKILESAVRKAADGSSSVLGLQGRELMEQSFSIKVVAKRYEQLYGKLVAGHSEIWHAE